jgi:hypothetical protein
VREGQASFRVNALISPPGGATIPVDKTNQSDAAKTADSSSNNTQTSDNASAQTAKKLNYPFTILEFRENDEMPSPLQPASI